MFDNIPPGYERLAAIFRQALRQASTGIGMYRHANGGTFDKQPICEDTRCFGIGAPFYQAKKKMREAMRLLDMDSGTVSALQEIYGAINYLAAAAIVLQDGRPARKSIKILDS